MEWISVENKLPALEQKVLAYDSQRIYIAFRPQEVDYNEHWSVAHDQDEYPHGCTGAITHWMPLPDVPNE